MRVLCRLFLLLLQRRGDQGVFGFSFHLVDLELRLAKHALLAVYTCGECPPADCCVLLAFSTWAAIAEGLRLFVHDTEGLLFLLNTL